MRAIYKIIVFLLISCASYGQGIGLYQIERAPGQDYTIITDANGMQYYVTTDSLGNIVRAPVAKGLFNVTADTLQLDVKNIPGDTIFRTIYKVITQGNNISLSSTDDQIITDLSLSGDTLNVSIEDGNTKQVVLSGVSTVPVIEEQTISTNTMTVVATLPADTAKYTVYVGPVKMIEVVTPSHVIEYSRSGQVLTFYENLESEKVRVRIID